MKEVKHIDHASMFSIEKAGIRDLTVIEIGQVAGGGFTETVKVPTTAPTSTTSTTTTTTTTSTASPSTVTTITTVTITTTVGETDGVVIASVSGESY